MLEFLVAFTLLVVFLTAIFAALAVAIRSDRKAALLSLGTILARSKLAAAGIDYPLSAGVSGGTFPNGYRWQAVIRPHGTVAAGRGRPLSAFRIEVTVAEPTATGDRIVSLAGIEIDRGSRP